MGDSGLVVGESTLAGRGMGLEAGFTGRGWLEQSCGGESLFSGRHHLLWSSTSRWDLKCVLHQQHHLEVPIWFWYIALFVMRPSSSMHWKSTRRWTDCCITVTMPTSASAKSSVNTMLMQSKDPCVVAPRATTGGGGSGLWALELIVARIGILRTMKPLITKLERLSVPS